MSRSLKFSLHWTNHMWFAIIHEIIAKICHKISLTSCKSILLILFCSTPSVPNVQWRLYKITNIHKSFDCNLPLFLFNLHENLTNVFSIGSIQIFGCSTQPSKAMPLDFLLRTDHGLIGYCSLIDNNCNFVWLVPITAH